jgi:4-hydroxy-tetrahydrodipicolinate synthase
MGAMADGKDLFRAGADAVVACPPVSMPVEDLLAWFKALLDRLPGPMLLYNMPSTTKVSIPLDVVAHLLGHPKLAGIKDSENNPERLEGLLKWFGGQPSFSVFVGVGALMARGLRLGADGIVPSVGNLIPKVCRGLCDSAQRGDWASAQRHARRMNAVAALYQNGRTLGQSLAALKGALHCRGVCAPQMLPPLLALPEQELKRLRDEMSRLHLLNGASDSNGS